MSGRSETVRLPELMAQTGTVIEAGPTREQRLRRVLAVIGRRAVDAVPLPGDSDDAW
jgi:hypothetical protein